MAGNTPCVVPVVGWDFRHAGLAASVQNLLWKCGQPELELIPEQAGVLAREDRI